MIQCLTVIGRQFGYLHDDAEKQEEYIDWIIDQWVSRVIQ